MRLVELYQVELPYATFGIVVTDNIVVEAAPIGKWMIGKLLPKISNWVVSKRGNMRMVKGEEVD